MFGGSRKREAAQAQMEEVVARLKALDPAQIAIELMTLLEPFGPEYDAIPAGSLAKCLAPDYGRLRGEPVQEFVQLVDEGAQKLVQAGLFTFSGWGGLGDGNVYGLSREGRDALENGTVAERLAGA